ncbi:GntR family transcriptional regulator [Paenibacillus cremeus]|uniref:GntR family transcriptional regulator n=1 Tax=Paenibacillus cremeus TaxID=2163881 RepID=A0A559KFU1_9BACL|nr:GntR family transcriptional regulator [Paenibacillus cremeus]TVY10987.1 GntR family transcriptional regulator [Paenibacillus cremeus]
MQYNTKSRSAYQQSYEVLRDMILKGEIAQGTKLVEEKLAADLGVSRTPIRESIRKLEQEGLIVNKRVVSLSETDLRNTFELRKLLEGYAVRSAAAYLSDKALLSLERCVEIGQSGTKDEIMEANKEFHEIIMCSTNNPLMIDLFERMQSVIYLFRQTVVYFNRPFLIEEHHRICEAIKAHDGDTAERLMKEHLQADLDFYVHLNRHS